MAFIIAFILSVTPGLAHAPDAIFVFLERAKEPQATVLFVGDMMFDRIVRTKMQEMGDDHVLECISDVLKSANTVVGNLEGPITDLPSMSVGSVIGTPENFTFTFATSTATLLARHNVSIVNLGNNHILNLGPDGVTQTMRWLDGAGVRYFGDSRSGGARRIEIARIPLHFINYNEFGGNKDTTLREIAQARQEGDIPVVYTHWGDEYATTSAERQRTLAHSFVESGAELVIGSHPHVIQEHEIYLGKHIYYSLGNFVFDQYWNADVSTGLLVRVVFSPEGVISVEETKVKLERDRRTCPLNSV